MKGKKGFQKGVVSSVAGRGKGNSNKVTKEARELFVMTLEKQVPNIEQAFNDVLFGVKSVSGAVVKFPDPAKYLELYAKYAQYFVPKQLDVNIGGKVITVVPPDEKKQD